MKFIYAGGPCTCRPGRYVRYVVPEVPGLRGEISCRENGAAEKALATHGIPAGAIIAMCVPNLGGAR